MEKIEKEFEISGSLMNGPDIDIFKFVEDEFSAEEIDSILEWSCLRDILLEIDCEEFEVAVYDDIPGMSDRFFQYRCGPKSAFINRLREWLMDNIEERKTEN